MLRTEEKLSIEIRLFYEVIVSNRQLLGEGEGGRRVGGGGQRVRKGEC